MYQEYTLLNDFMQSGTKFDPNVENGSKGLLPKHNPTLQTGHSGSGAVIQIGRSLARSQMVSLRFFIDIKSFRSHYGPGVDSASNRNEYQEYFLGVKSAGV